MRLMEGVMTDFAYHLIDKNTGEEVYASEDFNFTAVPVPDHRLHDPALMERYGGPAVVDHVEQVRSAAGVEVKIFIDGVEERVNAGNEDDENYRRS
jgi:hypothetical protein